MDIRESIGTLAAPLLDVPRDPPTEKRRKLPLLDSYLREQRDLTAVERFAQRHADVDRPLMDRYYRDALPAEPPGVGQQYAFQVDLDACTGCKACVTACHNLNGLDDDETWRSVGLLHGGTAANPVQQTVTTACHHCLEPACMNGCPVGAYEKDALTGIVRHLDDQCIGCQYCTFTCPYDVPQYNPKRGIVRKCDMCSDRLAEGEAPACVQACPNHAIAITVVNTRDVLDASQSDAFLPGTPSPRTTLPTTVYRTERALPRNVLPANFWVVKPSHQHLPLVVMLVLTQLAVGAFAVDALVAPWLPSNLSPGLRSLHAVVALLLGLSALGASVLHLGRPLYAFRALIGLRTSWMSREILSFGLFATFAVAYALSLWPIDTPNMPSLTRLSAFLGHIAGTLQALVLVTGLCGVLCSVLIYHVTRRPFWNIANTAFRFFSTAVLLGLATAMATLPIREAWVHDAAATAALAPIVMVLARLLLAASVVKGLGELLFLRHLFERCHSEQKRSALLMTQELRGIFSARMAVLAMGGLILPWFNLSAPRSIPAALATFVLLLAGELLERTLFFAAACTPGMPKGPQ